MAGLPRIDWSRLGFEAVIIIGSVLAALALDDWRDAKLDRELEQHLLVGLQDDLASDIKEIEDALMADEAIERASSSLLGRSDLGATGSDFQKAGMDTIVRGVGDFDLSDITYQEIMSTGTFRVIRNSELRRKISHYYWLVQSFNITNETAQAYRFDLLRALLRNGVAPGAIGFEKQTSIMENEEIRALVAQLGITARNIKKVHGRIREQAAQLLVAVEAELGQ